MQFMASGISGPYFFKNEAGRHVNVNGSWSCSMITDYLLLEIEARDVVILSFIKTRPMHTAGDTLTLQRNYFGDCK